jgi:hypothetical protein
MDNENNQNIVLSWSATADAEVTRPIKEEEEDGRRA